MPAWRRVPFAPSPRAARPSRPHHHQSPRRRAERGGAARAFPPSDWFWVGPSAASSSTSAGGLRRQRWLEVIAAFARPAHHGAAANLLSQFRAGMVFVGSGPGRGSPAPLAPGHGACRAWGLSGCGDARLSQAALQAFPFSLSLAV